VLIEALGDLCVATFEFQIIGQLPGPGQHNTTQ